MEGWSKMGMLEKMVTAAFFIPLFLTLIISVWALALAAGALLVCGTGEFLVDGGLCNIGGE